MLNDDESTSSSSSSNSSNRSDDEEDDETEDDDVGNTSLTTSNDDNDTGDKSSWSTKRNDDSGIQEVRSTGNATATVSAVVGHHKKRIKLSLGGAFKAMIASSSEQESQEQQQKQQQLKKRKATTTSQIEDNLQTTTVITKKQRRDDDAGIDVGVDVDNAKIALKQKGPNSTGPTKKTHDSILDTQTKSLISTTASSAKKESSRVPTIKSETTDNASAVVAPAKNGTKIKLITTKQSKSNSKPKMAAVSATASASASSIKSGKPKETKRRQLPKLSSSSSTIAGENNAPPIRKRSSMRSIRITPMSSPGLLLPPGSTVRGANSAFTQTMATAGYTTEARTKNPHRGSSVQRIVDDMFDSNVKFCLRFPKLVPDEYLVPNPSLPPKESPSKTVTTTTTAVAAPPQSSSSSDPSATTTKATITTATTSTSASMALPSTKDSKPTSTLVKDHAEEKIPVELKDIPNIMKRLTKAFQIKTNDKKSDSMASPKNSLMNETKKSSLSPSINADASSTTSSRKRSSMIPQYADIVPKSLTLTYPEDYIQKRLEYVKKINEREKAIVDLQEKQDALQTAPEASAKKPTKAIPPIPRPPNVPLRDDLRAITNVEEIFGSEDQQQRSHPLYLPKNQQLVDHLDKRCFHSMHDRYFGLSSNAIADPYFFGPNAPGIGGLNLSASTGLATASTGGGGGYLGSPLFTMPAQPSLLSAASSKTAPTSSARSTSSNTNTVDKPIKAKSPLQATRKDFTKNLPLAKTIVKN